MICGAFQDKPLEENGYLMLIALREKGKIFFEFERKFSKSFDELKRIADNFFQSVNFWSDYEFAPKGVEYFGKGWRELYKDFVFDESISVRISFSYSTIETPLSRELEILKYFNDLTFAGYSKGKDRTIQILKPNIAFYISEDYMPYSLRYKDLYNQPSDKTIFYTTPDGHYRLRII